MSALSLTLHRPTYGTGTKTAYTGTAGSSSVTADSNAVLVWCSTVAYVALGKTATTADMPIPANYPIIIPIPKSLKNGGPITVSAIQDASGGNLHCIGCAE